MGFQGLTGWFTVTGRAKAGTPVGGKDAPQTVIPQEHELGAAIAAAENFARMELETNDASHDFWCAHTAHFLATK